MLNKSNPSVVDTYTYRMHAWSKIETMLSSLSKKKVLSKTKINH